ncbi:MAG: XrtA system polysaccharide deacetylase [Thermoguttaceae bacterium]
MNPPQSSPGNGFPVILNAFTVDVEDYFQVSAFEPHVSRQQWGEFESRVVPNTHRMLGLLDRHKVRATFFILGWVANRFPQLVRDIHRCGHEIACHGYWHRLIYEQSPEEFRADVCLARDLLEQIIGRPVAAYRAPSFSITRRSLWALEILVEEGFRADSSIFPIRHDRYGIPDARRTIHQRRTSAGTIWELPPAVARVAQFNVPVSGGGYFRFFPLSWTLRWLARINRAEQEGFVFYIHPWELDPDQPRMPRASARSRFRHYLNLGRTERRLDRLLDRMRFGRVSDVTEQLEADGNGRGRLPLPAALTVPGRPKDPPA